MKKELLLLIEKHTDTLIERTKTRPRETRIQNEETNGKVFI